MTADTSDIEVVGCHAEGEVGDVIVGGVAPPPGDTLWEQSRWIAGDQTLRNQVLNEPRGGIFRHVNLLVPPKHPDAQIGYIIMEPEHTPPMSGSNTICVATVALETGLVEMIEPTTTLLMEAPGGLVEVTADCADGKATSITFTNVPCFVHRRDAMIDVEGLGSLRVDTAFGGDSFALIDAADLGFAITPDEAADLAKVGTAITAAASEQLGFVHPTLDWNHISFCQIAGPLTGQVGHRTMRSTTVIEPGKLDRSPTGTGVSARMALLHAQGLMGVGDRLEMRSVIDSMFLGSIASTTTIGDLPAIIPTITGRAWITGRTTHSFDPTDPWPEGYRLTDTWPAMTHRSNP